MARKNTKKIVTQAAKALIPAVTKVTTPTLAPVSTELTAYGTKAYRTPVRKGQFTGTQGSAQEALVLDIDGTMQGWGGGLDPTLKAWCEKHYQRNPDLVFLVVTARDHEYMYESSFNWCMRDFPYPFIGPFCRALDDPRLASEFKRQLALGFEEMGLYRIIGAADDNQYVNTMWKHWKATRNPSFDLLECDAYSGYGDWRSGLASKGTPYTYTAPAKTTSSAPAAAKNRPAGTTHYASTEPIQHMAWSDMTMEQRQRYQDRMDLEDLAMELDHRLTLDRAQQLDTQELLDMVNKAESEAAQMVAEETSVVDAEVVA